MNDVLAAKEKDAIITVEESTTNTKKLICVNGKVYYKAKSWKDAHTYLLGIYYRL